MQTIDMPATALEWGRWAAQIAVERELSRSQAQVLSEMTKYVDRHGECFPSTASLAAGTRVSRATVFRALGELEQLGLVQTSQRGNGRTALRQLIADPPDPQLSLFDEPVLVDVAAPVRAEQQSHPEGAAVSSGETQKCHTEEGQGERARDARTTSPAVSPSLNEVLSILSGAPGLNVEPMAVDQALRAHPDAPHARAAHTVASWAHEGGLRTVSANRLLLAELRRLDRKHPQGDPRLRPPAATGSSRRRRRPGAEPDHVVDARHERQNGAFERMFAGTGFLVPHAPPDPADVVVDATYFEAGAP